MISIARLGAAAAPARKNPPGTGQLPPSRPGQLGFRLLGLRHGCPGAKISRASGWPGKE